jgi:hypothetical protein
MFFVDCFYCGINFKRGGSINPNRKHYFCSKEHYSKAITEFQLVSGAKNSNYNKRWSKETKLQFSETCKRLMTAERKVLIGNQHRGKKVTEEQKRAMSLAHLGKKGTPHTKESKIKIGIKSSAKFTDAFKKQIREKNEASGVWISLSQKDDYQLYCKFANWPKRMWDQISNEKEKKLFEEFGIWNSKNQKLNPGCVRDHKFSRRSGFRLEVFPEILRHPCNLQILLHSQNVAKKKDRYVDRDDQTLEELIFKIKNFNQEWFEQKECLQKIEAFLNGKKYSKEEYIRAFYDK